MNVREVFFFSDRGFEDKGKILDKVLERDVIKKFKEYLSRIHANNDIRIIAIALMAHGSIEDR